MFHPADMQLDDSHERALVAPLAHDPEVAETFNVWLFDGERNIAFNVHPRATGGEMDSAITIFLPDGRIARANHGSPGRFTDPARPASAFVKLHCEVPFKRWRVDIVDAAVYLSDDAGQASATVADETPTATISLSATIDTVAPPWINGALLPESRQTLQDQVSWWFGNRLTSGFSREAFRYDQLIEGSGEVRFEGKVLPIAGVGLRGHVRGVRRMPGMVGHCWSEGYSADGRRGFGMSMFNRAGGGYVHTEGFLFEDGRMYPARVLCTPHLDRDPQMRDAVFELACDELGLRRILATEMRAWWWQLPGWGVHGTLKYGWNPQAPMLMRQAMTRFDWEDGAVGYGLVERSG